MTYSYPIIEVDRDLAYDVEQLGTKRKFWFRKSEAESVRWLFKAEERSTGEDWAEKIACELCELLGIPHVYYDLATETASGTPGVVCPNIVAPPLVLVLGNQLLFERDASYPAADEKKYGVRHHSIDLVVEALRKLELPPSEYCKSLPSGIDSALGVFVGFAMLDALIANQDRHHQNWGALRSNITMLAPTFDHGAALARNEPEHKRSLRLSGPDPNYNIQNFAKKANSSFYRSQDSKRPLGTLDAFREFAKSSPKNAEIWLERLKLLARDDFEAIIVKIPASRMSTITREFTIQLLEVNQNFLIGS